MKASKGNKKQADVKKTRKQSRKEQRQQKKARRNDYYTKRRKPGAFVLRPPEEEPQVTLDTNRKIQAKKNAPRINDRSDQQAKDVAKEKREQQKLSAEMFKQRKKQMVQANEEEDRTIKRLEKQLKLNKRKSKSVPKSFSSDGLDYLLEVCDAESMKNIVMAEQQITDGDVDFEEDFALMVGKSRKNKKSDDDGSDLESFLNEDDGSSDEDSEHSNSEECDEDSENDDLKLKKKRRKVDEDFTENSEHGDNKLKKKLTKVTSPAKKSRFNEESDEFSDDEDQKEHRNDIIRLRNENEKYVSNDRHKGHSTKIPEDRSTFNESFDEESSDGEDLIEDESGSKDEIYSSENEDERSENEDDEDECDDSDSSNAQRTTVIQNQKEGKKRRHDKPKPQKSVEKGEFLCEEEDIGDSDGDTSADGDDYDDDVGIVEGVENGEEKDETWEDIYGRTRDKDGNVINKTVGKYIPPAVRAKMEAGLPEDAKRKEKIIRLRRQLKGLLNRLAETNMHSISNQIEDLYMQNSRYEMNDALTSLIFEALVSNVLAPERLLLEHVLLVTVLHANVGTEVGAHFLQTMIRKFDELFTDKPEEGKNLDNVVNVISQLYNFKVFHSQLLYQVLARLSENFTEKNVECILGVLKSVGFTLRKDDPIALKDLILDLQRRATSASEECKDNPRVKFMLEILLAIKNNNMNKIPNYDTSYSEHLKKIMKGFVRKGNYVTQLNISLDDLLKADERGKWWVVGSAWTGKVGEDIEKPGSEKAKEAGYSRKLLELAKKQRMNTDIRRNVFCIIMSAEDYFDAFEKLLHVGLKNQQEREIVHVLIHCCLHEKRYNPYYSFLAQKFCDYDRRFQMTIKYSIWDKLKTLTDCSGLQISNLAKLLTHLFLEKGLPLSVLKVVEFGDLDKVTLRFVRQILLGMLLHENVEQCQEAIERVARTEKLRTFRERLRLFVHHFLLRNVKAGVLDDEQRNLLEERSKMIDRVLTAGDKMMKF